MKIRLQKWRRREQLAPDEAHASTSSSLSGPAQSEPPNAILTDTGNSSQDLLKKTGKNAFIAVLESLRGISSTIPVAGAGVEAAARLLLGLIRGIEETRTNKQNFQNLAARIGRLSTNIQYRESQGQRDRVGSCCQALKRKLEELATLVQEALAQNRIEQFFNSSDDQAALTGYMKSLDSFVSDLSSEDLTEILAILHGWPKAQVTSKNAKPASPSRARLWKEFVNSGDWEEITCTIQSGRWIGGAYYTSSKFGNVNYQIQVAYSCIKWTIRTPYSQWFPGTYSGYLTLPQYFPFNAPNLYFETPIFSPNLNCYGQPSIDLLFDQWLPARTIKEIMDVVAFMLTIHPAYRADFSDELPGIPLKFHEMHTLTSRYYTGDKEQFRRAAIFFAGVYGRPSEDLIDNPTLEEYELQVAQKVVNELLEFIKEQKSKAEGCVHSSPFEHLKPGKSMLADFRNEERHWAEILAKEFNIIFAPPPKEEIEKEFARLALENGGEGEL